MKRVLVVDDDASNLYLMRNTLQSGGFAVDEARHGVEALSKALAHKPDLVITDLLMPEMDGYALLRRWKMDQALKDIPFIVYTATYTDSADEQLAIDMGADAFIVKPLEPDALLSTISTTIQRTHGAGHPAHAPQPDAFHNEQALVSYNAALVRKLEKRSLELERLAAERARSALAFQTSEALFRSLVDHALDMVMQTVPGGAVLWANQAACEGFGLTLAQITQADRTELLDWADPRLAPLFEERAQTGRMRGEVTAIRSDGSRFPVEVSSVIYETPDHEQVASFTIRDLSAQKAAEAALQESRSYIATLQAAMDAHAMLSTSDADGNITYVNEHFCTVSGYTHNEIVGCNYRVFRSGTHAPSEYEHLWATIRSGRVWKGELCNKAKDGSNFWVDTTIVPFVGEGAQPTRFVAIHSNITERKVAEQRRSELESQLREAQKLQAIGTLASGIAHDFNNIVAAILGFSGLLREEIAPQGDANDYLEQIQKAGKRARELVQRIMSFSRPHPTALESVVVQDAVNETLSIARATLPANIALQTRMDEAPVHVLADATQLQQVLLNLYTNAWHARSEEAARIETGLDTVNFALSNPARPPNLPPGHYAHLSISDNGHGMTAEVRARIFEPFFTTKPMGKGTGLGLATVRSIVGAHHGAIAVESTPETGSTFHLYFPLFTGAGQAAQPTAESAPHSPMASAPRILYVDDDEPIVVLANTLLTRAGFRVTTFPHAEQALAAVRAHPHDFDLMVTDFNMPGMSGMELAKRVQSIRADLPIAIVSGQIDADLRLQANAINIDTLIHKERVPEDLVRRLRQMLSEL